MLIVTAAVIQRDHLIFAARRAPGRHLAGYWEFPGGKVETGESPQTCLARELEEELTIQAQIGEFVAESIFDYGERKICLLAYRVQQFSGEIKLQDHDQSRWLPLQAMDSLQWAPADIPILQALKTQAQVLETAKFYSHHAQSYFEETIANDMSTIRDHFLSLIPGQGHILDLGCGSGRDSRFFMDAGFRVTALEESPELATLCEDHIGQSVTIKRYQNLDDSQVYEGIWACASLLHCPQEQIRDVLQRCLTALKRGGIFYLSFKHGEGHRFDSRGRFFNDYTTETLTELVQAFPELVIEKIWDNSSELQPDQQGWVSALLRKRGPEGQCH